MWRSIPNSNIGYTNLIDYKYILYLYDFQFVETQYQTRPLERTRLEANGIKV